MHGSKWPINSARIGRICHAGAMENDQIDIYEVSANGDGVPRDTGRSLQGFTEHGPAHLAFAPAAVVPMETVAKL